MDSPGFRIKTLIYKNNDTQRGLAIKLAVSRQSINQIISGTSKSEKLLFKIAEIYKVHVGWIMEGNKFNRNSLLPECEYFI